MIKSLPVEKFSSCWSRISFSLPVSLASSSILSLLFYFGGPLLSLLGIFPTITQMFSHGDKNGSQEDGLVWCLTSCYCLEPSVFSCPPCSSESIWYSSTGAAHPLRLTQPWWKLPLSHVYSSHICFSSNPCTELTASRLQHLLLFPLCSVLSSIPTFHWLIPSKISLASLFHMPYDILFSLLAQTFGILFILRNFQPFKRSFPRMQQLVQPLTHPLDMSETTDQVS